MPEPTELVYEKLIRENKLNVNDLPEHIRTGINEVKKKQRAVNMREKGNKNVTPNQMSGLNYADKQVSRDLQEYINESANKNKEKEEQERIKAEKEAQGKEDQKKKEAEEKECVEKEKNEKMEQTKKDPKGLEVDKELKKLLSDGKTQLTLEELKALAPVTYSIIFENYEKGGENGATTTFYSAIETEEGKFTISKI